MLFSWYFLLFDNIWHIVQMGICPWALRMTPGCLWKLWKCGATISATSLCSPSDDSGAELELCAIHLWWSFWYSLQNLISAFSLFKQEFKYLFAQLRSLSHYSNIQPLEGWCHGSGAWLYQAIIDVCTWTGTQLIGHRTFSISQDEV